MNKNIILLVSLLLLAACTRSFDGSYNLPGLYKIDVQQGNVIEQEMINKLTPGMDQDQVKFIMGTPVIIDPFHNERWEYIFSFQKGGGIREQRHITLHFEDEKLSHISGDIVESSLPRKEATDIVTEEEAIIVPDTGKKEKGFFGRLLEKINPLDDK